MNALPGAPIEDVRYAVHVKGGPDPGWEVRWLRLVEAVSAPYELELELIAHVTADDVDTDALLGADVELDIERGSITRSLCGLVHRVASVGSNSDELVVQLQVVPAWRYLAQHVDTRIFQDKTVPEILKEVLGAALGQYGRTLDTSRLHEGYVVRDYCVQYAESDFDFASRLMQEEGIGYVFRPEESGGKPTGVELMVLVDQEPSQPNADFEDVEGIFEGEVSIITDRPDTADQESLQSLEWTRPEQPNKIVLRRYNWKRPSPTGIPQAERSVDPRRGRVREIYIPDDRRRVEDELGNEAYEGTELDEDEAVAARRRFELFAGDPGRGHGTSNLVGMIAGSIFTLADHANPALAGKRLLVTRVVHVGHAPETQRGASSEGPRFLGTFECILADVPLRPALATQRPRIHGPQTAVVTGPPGEEIHTDIHGRIKVHFHWDRLSPFDDTSSCWVRVAQTLAGPGWGSWSLPRVGMEVIVDFLDGNPDRPLVTGCVYNGQNRPPYDMPTGKSKTTLKSQSTPGGGGSNELRFDDGAGGEEVYFHAQKDHNEVVENDHTRTVKNNETIRVDVDRSVSVGGNQTVSIEGDQTITVTGNQVVVVNGGGEGSPHYSITVNDDYALAAAKTVHVKAEERITLQCQTTIIELTPDRIVLQAGKEGSRIVLDVAALMLSKEQGHVFLDDAGNVLAKAKDEASLSLTSAALLQSQLVAKVELTGEAKLAAAEGGADLLLNADATMQGNAVTLTSAGAQLGLTTDAALLATTNATVAAAAVTCAGESVTIQGATVDVLGAGVTTVKGSVVKIN